jgi:imidazoleglycerol phosphate synthase glutamine amidotransferase subunit HisH
MGWNELELRGESKLLRGFHATGKPLPDAPADPSRDLSDRSHDRKGVVAPANPKSSLPGARPFVYFAHSYYAPEGDYASAVCAYEVPYTAALEVGSVFGVQFHPEKSGAVGLAIVRNFVEC